MRWQEREKREETSSPETEKKTFFLRNGIAFFFSWLTRSLSLSLSHGGGGGLRTSLSLSLFSPRLQLKTMAF